MTSPEYVIEYLNTYFRTFGATPAYIPITPKALETLRERVLSMGGVTLTFQGALTTESHGPDEPINYGDVFGGAILVMLH